MLKCELEPMEYMATIEEELFKDYERYLQMIDDKKTVDLQAICEHEQILIDYIIKHYINRELQFAENKDYPKYMLTLKKLKEDLLELKRNLK